MFDIGWSELLIIGVVALIVIGPKDLPEMFRTLGRFTAKARSMSRDFQRAMETAARDTGVNDIARDVKNVASPKNLGLDAVRNAADRFEKWDPLKPTAKAATPAAAATAPAALSPDAPVDAAVPVTAPAAPMGPATAALAEAKARDRAATLATVENRIAAPAVVGPDAGPAPKSKKSAAKLAGAAPAKPVKTKSDAKASDAKASDAKTKVAGRSDVEAKPRKPRKATSESSDA